MTTIIATRKEMVADSRTSWDVDYCTTPGKIEVVRRCVIGCAGDTPAINKFLTWFRKPRSEVEPFFAGTDGDDSFVALALARNGLFLYADSCVPMRIGDEFMGIGSGGGFAKAAMMAGATSERAVEIACMCDKNSGPPIQRITLAQALRSKG